MLDRLGLVELDEAGTRHRMDCVTGRIRDEMEMKPRQHHIHPFRAELFLTSCASIAEYRTAFYHDREIAEAIPLTANLSRPVAAGEDSIPDVAITGGN